MYSAGKHLAILSLVYVYAGADPGFVGPEAYTNFMALFRKKNTKLRTKVNVYLGPFPVPWKGPVQVRGPADLASFASR